MQVSNCPLGTINYSSHALYFLTLSAPSTPGEARDRGKGFASGYRRLARDLSIGGPPLFVLFWRGFWRVVPVYRKTTIL